MERSVVPPENHPQEMPRVLGHLRGERPGPMLLAIGGLHGNEMAGVLSLARVLEALAPEAARLSGDFVALAGNRRALAQGCRFLGRDLNRSWGPGKIEGLRRAPPSTRDPDGPPPDPDDEEQRELLQALDGALGAARGEAFLMDLHTTSGPGAPFSTVSDSGASRHFARSLPVPLILGLGQMLEGTLTGYMARLGVPAVVFEGGEHGTPGAIAALEAAVWLGLAATGLIREDAFPQVARGWQHLRLATRGLPPVLELEYRHAVGSEDGFRMLPGFKSFQPVQAGQLLARDRGGDVSSPGAGRLLLPLYQPQGEDGFFLVREVEP